MPLEEDRVDVNKPYLLALKGRVTVHFLDGQTLTGEIIAQDAFNIFLTVEDAPLQLSRSQIRYIKGEPDQAIEPDTAAVSVKAPAAPRPAPQVSQPEPEPAAEVAYFVEEEEMTLPEEDTGGTLVIPPLAVPATPAVGDTDLHRAVAAELDEGGQTIVLPADAETTAEIAAAPEVSPAAPPGLDEDATFVLAQEEETLAHLVCTTGPHAGEVFQLRPAITTIGRASDNACPLSKDKEVSRRHAIIAYEASKFVIQDQNSLNGTFVNNELIKEPTPLEDGDIILIGISTLKFQERS